jgi:membrane protein YqaA with SNARE-associated domain
VVASFGAAIGEMSAYILGLLGIKTIQRMSEERVEKILALGESLANKGIPIVFLGALTPFPFDFIGIAAGLLKYNPKKFFIAAFVGKAVRYIIIAFAGFIGAASVKAWFGI